MMSIRCYQDITKKIVRILNMILFKIQVILLCMILAKI